MDSLLDGLVFVQRHTINNSVLEYIEAPILFGHLFDLVCVRFGILRIYLNIFHPSIFVFHRILLDLTTAVKILFAQFSFKSITMKVAAVPVVSHQEFEAVIELTSLKVVKHFEQPLWLLCTGPNLSIISKNVVGIQNLVHNSLANSLLLQVSMETYFLSHFQNEVFDVSFPHDQVRYILLDQFFAPLLQVSRRPFLFGRLSFLRLQSSGLFQLLFIEAILDA